MVGIGFGMLFEELVFPSFGTRFLRDGISAGGRQSLDQLLAEGL